MKSKSTCGGAGEGYQGNCNYPGGSIESPEQEIANAIGLFLMNVPQHLNLLPAPAPVITQPDCLDFAMGCDGLSCDDCRSDMPSLPFDDSVTSDAGCPSYEPSCDEHECANCLQNHLSAHNAPLAVDIMPMGSFKAGPFGPNMPIFGPTPGPMFPTELPRDLTEMIDLIKEQELERDAEDDPNAGRPCSDGPFNNCPASCIVEGDCDLEDPRKSAYDTQVGGQHYKDKPYDVAQFNISMGLGFAEGNIVKYAVRHQDKNGAEDIKKIIHYAQFILETVYGIRPE